MMCLRCGALLTYWPREIFTRGCPSCNRAWRFNGRTPGKEE
jgi:predicted  nucleic acid-binding Zn-ribbon protein